MKFLLDQNVYLKTANFLKTLGYDVIRVTEIGLAQASDEELLLRAKELGRILVTRDKDFGHLVFVKNIKTPVILLKIFPGNLERVHNILKLALEQTNSIIVNSSFIVIESDKYRIRTLTK